MDSNKRVLLDSAWGDYAAGVPEGYVKAVFRGANDREETYYIPRGLYEQRKSFASQLEITPQDFAERGSILRVANPVGDEEE